MPHYRSAGVDIYLSTTSLDASTSAAGAVFDKKQSTSIIARNEQTLASGEWLTERLVPDEDGLSVLRFIGAKNNLPLLLACVDSNQVLPADHPMQSLQAQSQPQESVLSRSSQPSEAPKDGTDIMLDGGPVFETRIKQQQEPRGPMAMTLNIDLSRTDYFRHPQKDGRTDVKVEVYYNGSFAACNYIATRYNKYDKFTGKDKASQVVLRFSGRRVLEHYERPWVLQPHDERPSAVAPGASRHKEKWEQVSASLVAEAGQRGVNKYNESSPITDYLFALAQLDMPASLGSAMFAPDRLPGILDVVLSLGDGIKYDPSKGYIAKPTLMADQRYCMERRSTSIKPSPDERVTKKQCVGNSVGDTTQNVDIPRTPGNRLPWFVNTYEPASPEPTRLKIAEHTSGPQERTESRPRKKSTDIQTPLSSFNDTLRMAIPRATGNRHKDALAARAMIEAAKRALHIPADTASSPSTMAQTPTYEDQVVQPSLTNGQAHPNFKVNLVIPPIVPPYLAPLSKAPRLVNPSLPSFKELESSIAPPGHAKNLKKTLSNRRQNRCLKNEDATAPESSLKPAHGSRKRKSRPGEHQDYGYAWKTPDLSIDSVLSYAGAVTIASSGQASKKPLIAKGQYPVGGMREVRKERTGDFREDSILCGVRFVVG